MWKALKPGLNETNHTNVPDTLEKLVQEGKSDVKVSCASRIFSRLDLQVVVYAGCMSLFSGNVRIVSRYVASHKGFGFFSGGTKEQICAGVASYTHVAK